MRAVNGIAASMAIATTAEGVESEAHFEHIVQERCDEAQGYLFSPPRPASDIPLSSSRSTAAG